MPAESYSIRHVRSGFRLPFRHAKAVRTRAGSVAVKVQNHEGTAGYGEGCPREYVSGENPAGVAGFIKQTMPRLIREVRTASHLTEWIRLHESRIRENPAAFSAMETALVDLFSRENNITIEEFLGAKPPSGNLLYSAVAGNSSLQIFEWTVKRYLRSGFRDFKIKFSDNLLTESRKLKFLSELENNHLRFRFDSNNSDISPSDLIRFWRSAPLKPWALEEPVRRGDFRAMAAVSAELETAVILDESFTGPADFEHLEKNQANWILNIRVSRYGGLIRSSGILREAAKRGIPVIIGAHVGETSVLTRAGIALSAVGGSHVIAREGAFGNYLLWSDPFRPVISFSEGGILCPDSFSLAQKSGNGLSGSNFFQGVRNET